MRIKAERVLLAPVDDVWALLAEPHHLADWWPGYLSVRPDRRGLEKGARWQLTRNARAMLFKRPYSEGLLLVTGVDPGRSLSWRDVDLRFVAEIRIEPDPEGTRATVSLEAPWLRLAAEELRRAPRQALTRLHALCQTAARL